MKVQKAVSSKSIKATVSVIGIWHLGAVNAAGFAEKGGSRCWRWGWRSLASEDFHRGYRNASDNITACQPNVVRAVGVGWEVAPAGDEWNPY
jgi:hypothetical protein